MEKFLVELTDTFAGEANYSWCKREIVTMPDRSHYRDSASFQRELMRRAKKAVGMTGTKGVVSRSGDFVEFRPYRLCMVMFILEHEE